MARSNKAGPERCRRKFLRFFPGGFFDETYLDWERDYKWDAHEAWNAALGRETWRRLVREEAWEALATSAVRIESRTNLLFSFEKMALRDAVRGRGGARAFVLGLDDLLNGTDDPIARFDRWCEVVAGLPRKQTRVLTWPLATVFGFIAEPRRHFFLKPMVTRLAVAEYGAELEYKSRPNGDTYREVLALASRVRKDLADLRPRDQIDIQSFLWVQGSDEYEE